MKVLTRALIKSHEENAVNSGIFSFEGLMKTAGDKVFEIIKNNYNLSDKKIAVVCGNGNNGGDGFVIAQNLRDNGYDVTVITPLGEPKTDTAKFYYNKLCGIKITQTFEDNYGIIIDALFGIGLNRELGKEIICLIEKINFADALRISVDIPSGINCDNGKILAGCINADLTVTFIALKPCFMLPPATDYCGKVTVADIGITPKDFIFETIEEPKPIKRKHNSHKGTFGTAVLFCGSYGMLGAAILSAKSCLRSGVGIAKCVLCKSIYKPFTVSVPEAVCVPVRQTLNGSLSSNINIKKITEKATAILFGCGVKNTKSTEKLLKKLILNTNIPLIIDADGINVLSRNIELLKKANAPIILTPHPAEMARLCKKTAAEVEADRVNTAINFAKKYNCYLVLKGANTIVCTPDSEVFFNMNGNPGLATGGSGDVLAGIIVSKIAQGIPICEALKSAVYIHGNAAEQKTKILGEEALLPSDIIEAL